MHIVKFFISVFNFIFINIKLERIRLGSTNSLQIIIYLIFFKYVIDLNRSFRFAYIHIIKHNVSCIHITYCMLKKEKKDITL